MLNFIWLLILIKLELGRFDCKFICVVVYYNLVNSKLLIIICIFYRVISVCFLIWCRSFKVYDEL